MPSVKKELGCGIVDIGDGEREIVATGVSALFDFNRGTDFSVYIYNLKSKTWRSAGKLYLKMGVFHLKKEIFIP